MTSVLLSTYAVEYFNSVYLEIYANLAQIIVEFLFSVTFLELAL